MRSTMTVRRLAAMCALLVAWVMFTAPPAVADTSSTQERITHNDPGADFWVWINSRIFLNGPGSQTSTVSSFASFKAETGFYTTANDCSADIWLTLSVDKTSSWDSPHYGPYSCK